ncbi:hypothetical protein [Rheinheimera salexigens]|uniref:Uncharacterized protein n=1 Tax=Rheinheimera salexigens TaxID=1628148 RepID=A0A1E7Q9B2_9GAMM|nr:hypothetical protein [Rheinheimera salexigens]OEY70691.1 hypothetical protein BI198_14805 [Rheinheimera salexigens]
MNQITTNQQQSFSIDEVVNLINKPVIRHNRGDKFVPENIGLVVGVVTLNEEVEMVVKFIDRITQFTKTEFNKSYRVIKE